MVVGGVGVGVGGVGAGVDSMGVGIDAMDVGVNGMDVGIEYLLCAIAPSTIGSHRHYHASISFQGHRDAGVGQWGKGHTVRAGGYRVGERRVEHRDPRYQRTAFAGT